jgi:sec-independent protein translocase protein TatC
MPRVRPVGHEDRLSLVEHLDELRSRLIWSALFLGVAFAACFWQNHRLLDIVNRPLRDATQSGAQHPSGRLEATARSQIAVRHALEQGAVALQVVAQRSTPRSAADRQAIATALRSYQDAVQALPRAPPPREPVTLGIGEPLSTTLTVAAYFALLISMPFILYQLYAFVLPAFTPRERSVALSLMSMVPALFIVGVVFGYFVVLPPAIGFLQRFNSGSFDVLVQAKAYYTFIGLTLLAMGLVFQLPVAILGLTRLGIVSVQTLRSQRRYAIVIIAVIAMLLPGTDPITTLIEMVPLIVLYELSILMASWLDRLSRRSRDASSELGPPSDTERS